MASIEHTTLTQGVSNTNATSYNTAAITTNVNRLLLVFTLANQDGSSSPNNPTISGSGITWTQSVTQIYNNHRIAMSYAWTSNISTGGILTIDYGGQMQRNCIWVVSELKNVSSSSPIVQTMSGGRVSTTLYTMALNAFENSKNATIGFVDWETSDEISPGSGFTEVSEQTQEDGHKLFVEFKSSSDTSVDMSKSGGDNWCFGCSLEVKFSSSAGNTQAIIL